MNSMFGLGQTTEPLHHRQALREKRPQHLIKDPPSGNNLQKLIWIWITWRFNLGIHHTYANHIFSKVVMKMSKGRILIWPPWWCLYTVGCIPYSDTVSEWLSYFFLLLGLIIYCRDLLILCLFWGVKQKHWILLL